MLSSEVSSRVVASWRLSNHRRNVRAFGNERNTYRQYLSLIERHIGDGMLIDLGAGAVSIESYVPGVARHTVVAVDSDTGGLRRNTTRLRVVAEAAALPFRSNSVTLVSASCVLEHLAAPDEVFAECHRVLKQGGALVVYTPNKYSYVAMLAQVTPLAFHRWIRRLQTGAGAEETEVIGTYYRANTVRAVRRYSFGFDEESLALHIGEPCYTTFLPPPIHSVFIWIHKVILRVTWMKRLVGESIIGCLVRQ